MKSAKNISIRAVRESQKAEYRERRQAASGFGPDTLFGWKQSDKPAKAGK